MRSFATRSSRTRPFVVGAIGLAILAGGAHPASALGPKSGLAPEARSAGEQGPKQGPDALLEEVGIAQKLGEPLPLDLAFTNAAGERVELGALIGERPVVLALVYYECPMLCTMVLNGMLRVFNTVKFDIGRDFDVVTVSIDPRETAMLAADKKEMYLQRYRRQGAEEGWHFLVGDEPSIRRLADAVGFEYAYDPETDQYAHGSAIMVATPEGRLSKYLYGIEYSPIDLRLALVEAASERIGTLTDAILLACFQYDPLEGTYSLTIMRIVRVVGVLTVLAIIGFILTNLVRERRRRAAVAPPEGGSPAESSA